MRFQHVIKALCHFVNTPLLRLFIKRFPVSKSAERFVYFNMVMIRLIFMNKNRHNRVILNGSQFGRPVGSERISAEKLDHNPRIARILIHKKPYPLALRQESFCTH